MSVSWLCKKNIKFEKIEEIMKESFDSNHLTNDGPLVRRLENYIRKEFKISDQKAVIAVVNATAGLHTIVNTFNSFYDKKIQWVTQSFTFPSSAQGPLQDVIICDINEDFSLNIEEVDVDLINGIIVTNVFGQLVDIDKYVRFCKENDLFLIFDNAACPLSYYNSVNSSNYGNAAIISFHHTKPLGFGEGGAIIIDKNYESVARSMVNFGIGDRGSWSKFGSNSKMSDISAAFILQYMIDNKDSIVEHHQNLYKHARKRFESSNIKLLDHFGDPDHFPSCICVLINNSEDIIKYFNNTTIQCRKYYIPLKSLPHAQRLYKNMICIPCHIDVNVKQLDYVIDKILNFNELSVYSYEESLNLEIDWPDIYFTPEYGKLCQIHDNCKWECAVYANGLIIYTYMKRSVLVGNVEYYDLISPYGYSGIWYDDKKVSFETLHKFFNKFREIAENRRYICELIKFSPYIVDEKQILAISGNVDNMNHYKNTYGIKMSNTNYESYYQSRKSSHKNEVNKSLKDGYSFQIKKFETGDIDEFKKIYDLTMDKNNSNDYYYFSKEYFHHLCNLECYIAYVRNSSYDLVSSSLFLKHKNLLHYHLSGKETNERSGTHFLLNNVIKWAFNNDIDMVHLGGGVKVNDGLEKFKRRISNCDFKYYIGNNIFNNDVYNRLSEDITTNSDFFPKYRQKNIDL